MPRPEYRARAYQQETKGPTVEEVIAAESWQRVFGDYSARDWAMLARGLSLGVQRYGLRRMRDLCACLGYSDAAVSNGARWKGRVALDDVDSVVGRWREALVLMSTAHSHQGLSQGEQAGDQLLEPLLLAPIAQLREFTSKLAAALEADERVPFLVWSAFRRLVEPLVMKGPAGETIKLRTQLAQEVAELIEHDMDRAELIAAMAAALQWRAADTLEKVRTQLRAGQRPRLKGGESCLFVEVGPPGQEALVVL